MRVFSPGTASYRYSVIGGCLPGLSDGVDRLYSLHFLLLSVENMPMELKWN